MWRTTKPKTFMNRRFPDPPVAGSEQLVPIRTWREMFDEAAITGVEFDEFWNDSVMEGAAYFFRWLGEPRATVLVVWDDSGPEHIECRKAGDEELSEKESEPVIAEVRRLFQAI